MAEGWLRHLRGEDFDVFSAGIETHGLNPYAVQVMAEAGVDISQHESQLLSDLSTQTFDWVVTVCGHAHEHCPVFLGDGQVVHVGFDDPPKLARELGDTEAKLDCYRRVRDEIRVFVENFESRLGQ